MRVELINQFQVLITSAFGLVAALAWNEAVQSMLKYIGFQRFGSVIYAVLITIIAVFATFWIVKISERLKTFDSRLFLRWKPPHKKSKKK